MRRITVFMAGAMALLLSQPPAVLADACLDEARDHFIECKGDCRENYQLAKDTCAGRDHACMETCRADRTTCRQPVVDVLNAAIASCNATLATAKADCRALHADGSPELDACIDQAQVVAFLCRRTARRAAKPGLNACRSAFKACAKTNCPKDPDISRDVVKACKADAKDVFLLCSGECIEAKQLEKDACWSKDHACMETCRGDRATCLAVPLATRATLIGDCKTTRDAAIDNCRALYAPETPERTACVDGAQVAAFECRDAAREATAPDIQACRAAFQSCAEVCPPPAG